MHHRSQRTRAGKAEEEADRLAGNEASSDSYDAEEPDSDLPSHTVQTTAEGKPAPKVCLCGNLLKLVRSPFVEQLANVS